MAVVAGGLAAWIAAAGAAPATAAVATPGPAPGPPASVASAPPAQPASQGQRGRLVTAEHLRGLSAQQVAAELKSGGAEVWDTGTVRFGVDTYRLVYRTVDAVGRPTTASGLVALPRSGHQWLRTVSFTHGTAFSRADAPSVTKGVWGQAPVLTYASAGFAAVAPDYLGQGLGTDPHPWMHVPSETTATLDMLRAVRYFAPTTGRKLHSQVLATGFSQGASAALGLARALQHGADPYFRLGAVAPVSGAYAFRDVWLPALLNGGLNPEYSALYSAYTLVAFNRLYQLYDSPSEMFRPPHDRQIERLLDGSHTRKQVLEGIPGTPDELLTPQGRTTLAHPTGPLAAALRVTDSVCTNWTPRVPVRLYLATGDEQVTTANSHHCHSALRSRGVDAPLVDLGAVDHTGSRHRGSHPAATAALVRWFSNLSSS